MSYIKEYLKIIAYMLIGVVFSFSSFYLFINIFHIIELNKSYSIDINETAMVQDYYQKIDNIEKNVSNFQASSYKGTISTSKMMVVQQNIKQCATVLKSTYLEDIKEINDLTNKNKNLVAKSIKDPMDKIKIAHIFNVADEKPQQLKFILRHCNIKTKKNNWNERNK